GKKASYVKALSRPGAAEAWHFLTGEEPQIKRLAAAVGFRYVYDEASGQYAHPTGIMVLTPAGQLARYLYGVEYAPKDLKFALVEASHNTVGSPVDQVLLLCYKYDPMTGKYGLVLWNLLRIGGVLTMLAVGGIVAFFLMRERRMRRQVAASH
ncbi:MAG TPA: SCO family protein, partial [Bacteroidota bacterium]